MTKSLLGGAVRSKYTMRPFVRGLLRKASWLSRAAGYIFETICRLSVRRCPAPPSIAASIRISKVVDDATQEVVANAQLREFAERLKIPFEATRGGRETTHPEYQVTLKQLMTNSLRKGSD
jgi:hypothetical protein